MGWSFSIVFRFAAILEWEIGRNALSRMRFVFAVPSLATSDFTTSIALVSCTSLPSKGERLKFE